jgi:CBS-domain-containing membrane protein
MEDHTVISDLVSEGLDTIGSQESVRAAHRRMEAQSLRSLIVVDDDRPVGIVKWRALRSADSASTVATCMTTDFPVLRKDMHVTEAHGHIGDVDFDNIPVIDEEGRLVGEVPRGAIVHHEVPTDREDHLTATGDPAVPASVSAFPDLRAGMDVVAAEGGKLGKVTELSDDPTTHRLAHVLVEHGLLRKKHKRVPTDTIGRLDGDTVVLKISKTEWGILSDVEDQSI